MVSGQHRNNHNETRNTTDHTVAFRQQHDLALGDSQCASGGSINRASGDLVAVSGGRNRTALEEFDWVAGPFSTDL
jgi:hypothetical protein